jgi:peroxiredoxin
MFCREQAVQLHRELPEIRRRGAELAFIGNGNRHFAEGFKRDHGIECPLYVDTQRDSYRALGMKRGFGVTLGSPAALLNMARALKAGFRQGRTRGDAWQLGGVLVVRPGGRIAYRYLSNEAGDHPPVTHVMKSLGPASS